MLEKNQSQYCETGAREGERLIENEVAGGQIRLGKVYRSW